MISGYLPHEGVELDITARCSSTGKAVSTNRLLFGADDADWNKREFGAVATQRGVVDAVAEQHRAVLAAADERDPDVLRSVCFGYVKSVAALNAELLQSSPADFDREKLRQSNRDAQQLFCRLVDARRDALGIVRGTNEFAAFLSHAGEDKMYVDSILRHRIVSELKMSAFYDEDSIRAVDVANEVVIDRGMLTSRVGVVVLSEHFVRKVWPLYELFFILARCDVEGAASFRMLLDLFNGGGRDAEAWIKVVGELALPWSKQSECKMPPAMLHRERRVGAHGDRVLHELRAMMNDDNNSDHDEDSD